MSDPAMFLARASSVFVPTSAAVSPWDRQIVHGAAVVALFAGQLTPTDRTLARLTVDLLAPVPVAPLTLERSAPAGGRRVQREEAALSHDGRTVATARSVIVRRLDVELPEKALDHATPFDPAAAPLLAEPYPGAADLVGWENFDSRSVIIKGLRVPEDRRTHLWIRLALPVVEGTEIRGVEVAAVAADYASYAVSRQLSWETWSFRNAELTMHLSRDATGSWIGMRCEGVVQPVGAGFNTADLFDADGRFGRSAAALVVERHDT